MIYYRLNVSYDSKTMHLWSKHSNCEDNNGETANKSSTSVIKLIDVVKSSHSSITTIAYSPKYRLYLIITSDFKFLFLNELNNIVEPPLDMSSIRLVNHAYFYDE